MLETALVAFTTLFATVGPPDVAAVFAALTAKDGPAERRRYALRAILIAGGILLFFAVFGRLLLESLDITLAALRTAGGLLLFLIAVDLVFARDSGAVSTTLEENAEAATRQDISVFPIATPLIAGPGTIGATIVLIAEAKPDVMAMGIVLAMLAAVLVVTYVLMRLAEGVQRVLGVTGVHVISRIMGLLLAALAVQFVFDGIAASPLAGSL
ncbi:MAG: MarC family protein [Halofilum sp. (in: g-proteobacteria)]|nr:MarC family protein [Halofilum sp. (in: g-proteobacteria)]